MADAWLTGLTILVAEDEYLMASDIERELAGSGAQVLGPVSSLEQALILIEEHGHVDAALLDVNLQGESVFPVADILKERGVPFLFLTGYDRSAIPTRFGDVFRAEKPIGLRDIRDYLASVIDKASDEATMG